MINSMNLKKKSLSYVYSCQDGGFIFRARAEDQIVKNKYFYNFNFLAELTNFRHKPVTT